MDSALNKLCGAQHNLLEVTRLLEPSIEGGTWRLREQAGCKTSEWLAGPENCDAQADPSSNPAKPVAIKGYEPTAFIINAPGYRRSV